MLDASVAPLLLTVGLPGGLVRGRHQVSGVSPWEFQLNPAIVQQTDDTRHEHLEVVVTQVELEYIHR